MSEALPEMTRHQEIVAAYRDTTDAVKDICTRFNISRQRLHQHLARAGEPSRVERARTRIDKCITKVDSLEALAACAQCSVDTARRALRARQDAPEVQALFQSRRKAQTTQRLEDRITQARAAIATLARELGRTPSLKEAIDAGIGVRPLLAAVGGYSALVTSAGLTPNWKASDA